MVSHSTISAIKWGMHNMLSTLGVWGTTIFHKLKKKSFRSKQTGGIISKFLFTNKCTFY
jgi:hypothetical protein